jgi:hypothetical protein
MCGHVYSPEILAALQRLNLDQILIECKPVIGIHRNCEHDGANGNQPVLLTERAGEHG